MKCNTKESVIVTLGNTVVNESQNKGGNFLLEDEPITENGLFRGKKISELPNFMQRIYKKKKILYSKHLMSAPSNNNLPVDAALKTQ